MSRLVSEWRVPSRSVPGHYYTVQILNTGEAACPCLPPRPNKHLAGLPFQPPPNRCWHARLVLALEHETALDLCGHHTCALASAGDVPSQLFVLATLARHLLDRGSLSAASHCYSTIRDYLLALSTQAGYPLPRPDAVQSGITIPKSQSSERGWSPSKRHAAG